MKGRRAFTLTELLVVVAILSVLAALLFPVFSRTKARAQVTDCQSRLHQIALAAQMYRADHDGQLWLEYMDRNGGYTTAGRYRYPWNDWLALETYLKNGQLVWCPLPNRDGDEITVHNLLHLRKIAKPQMGTKGATMVGLAFEPDPGAVIAYCANHTNSHMHVALPTLANGSDLFEGDYPFLREDGSTSLAKGTAIVPCRGGSHLARRATRFRPLRPSVALSR